MICSSVVLTEDIRQEVSHTLHQVSSETTLVLLRILSESTVGIRPLEEYLGFDILSASPHPMFEGLSGESFAQESAVETGMRQFSLATTSGPGNVSELLDIIREANKRCVEGDKGLPLSTDTFLIPGSFDSFPPLPKLSPLSFPACYL